MSAEMREQIRKMRNFELENTKLDVIVTYDIQTIIPEFRKDMIDYLQNVHSGLTPINDSTYKINDQLNIKELEVMCDRIKEIYAECVRAIKEGRESKGTRVSLILPAVFRLYTIEVIADKL